MNVSYVENYVERDLKYSKCFYKFIRKFIYGFIYKKVLSLFEEEGCPLFNQKIKF